MNRSKLRVGIVGVGAMGRPVVDRLLAAGHEVAAYARRPEQQEALREIGVEVAPSLAAMGAGRDFVIIYVYSDDQARTVALDDGLLEAMDAGSMLVVHTTGSPKTVQAMAEHGASLGVRVVDAAGSGGPTRVAQGKVMMMVGGAEEDFAHVSTLLEAYADPVIHAGPLGAGQCMKLINNALFGANLQLGVEACRVGREFGLDIMQMAKYLGAYGSGGTAVLEMIAEFGSPEGMLKRGGPFAQKDILVAQKLADELGVDLGTIRDVNVPLLATLEELIGPPLMPA
jgi:3-hydroxyisobutyrate dehydrogenase-like beta-hydroxyacid dehydrogenase